FADLDGAPKVDWSPSRDFYARAREDYAEPPVWNGELYLELHRGTYSSQIHGKQGNRRTEALMHDVELWSATAARLVDGFEYPYEEIDSLWDKLLLLQFYDILPGSSIAWVHRESAQCHDHITERGEDLVAAALAAPGDDAATTACANSAGWLRRGAAPLGHSAAAGRGEAATVQETGGAIAVAAAGRQVEIDDRGLLTSLRAGSEGREAVATGAAGALLQMHRDAPNAWDSWDIDEFYRHVHRDLDAQGAPEVTRDEDGTVRIAGSYRTRE